MDEKSLKILAVDDNSDILLMIRDLLSYAFPEAQVITAGNGRQAIDRAFSEHPDILLLDILMPELDGFQVCKTLKQDMRTRHTPILFLTALNADSDTRIRALEAGGDGFISKPMDTAELTAQIRAMIKIRESSERQRLENDRLIELVAERTCELQKMIEDQKEVEEALQKQAAELREANKELETFNRVAVGRELRMIELKAEVNELCRQMGQPERYEIPEESLSTKDDVA